MANDPSMPPSEQNPGVPVDNSPAMSPEAPAGMPAPGGAASGGNVTISMPKAEFDAMHAIVMQLATALNQLKSNVDQPAGGPVPVGMASEPKPMEGGEPSDEDFLKGLAEEGNKR